MWSQSVSVSELMKKMPLVLSGYEENVMTELKKTFRPEFLNRVDEIIVFHPLSQDEIKEIASLMLAQTTKRLEETISGLPSVMM